MASIVVIVDDKAGPIRRVEFDRSPVSVGRGPENDLQLPLAFVSERHAQIRFDQDQAEYLDLGSTNGTVVSGQRIPAHTPVPVETVLDFHIGPVRLTLERPGRGAPSAGTPESLPRAPFGEPPPPAPEPRDPSPFTPPSIVAVLPPELRATPDRREPTPGERRRWNTPAPPTIIPPPLEQGEQPRPRALTPSYGDAGPPDGPPSRFPDLPTFYPSRPEPEMPETRQTELPPRSALPETRPSPSRSNSGAGPAHPAHEISDGRSDGRAAGTPRSSPFSGSASSSPPTPAAEAPRVVGAQPSGARSVAGTVPRSAASAPISAPAGTPTAGGDDANELARLRSVATTLCEELLKLRAACEAFGRETGIRTFSRSERSRLHEVRDGAELLRFLTVPAMGKAREDDLRALFADLVAHQLALMGAIVEGARAALGRVDPEEFLKGNRRRLLPFLDSGRWDEYLEFFRSVREDDQALQEAAFGAEFAEAYAAARSK